MQKWFVKLRTRTKGSIGLRRIDTRNIFHRYVHEASIWLRPRELQQGSLGSGFKLVYNEYNDFIYADTSESCTLHERWLTFKLRRGIRHFKTWNIIIFFSYFQDNFFTERKWNNTSIKCGWRPRFGILWCFWQTALWR